MWQSPDQKTYVHSVFFQKDILFYSIYIRKSTIRNYVFTHNENVNIEIRDKVFSRDNNEVVDSGYREGRQLLLSARSDKRKKRNH